MNADTDHYNPSDADLLRVARDNAQTNQISDTTGVTPEVGEGIGFKPLGDAVADAISRKAEVNNPHWPDEAERGVGKAAIASIRQEHLNP